MELKKVALGSLILFSGIHLKAATSTVSNPPYTVVVTNNSSVNVQCKVEMSKSDSNQILQVWSLTAPSEPNPVGIFRDIYPYFNNMPAKMMCCPQVDNRYFSDNNCSWVPITSNMYLNFTQVSGSSRKLISKLAPMNQVKLGSSQNSSVPGDFSQSCSGCTVGDNTLICQTCKGKSQGVITAITTQGLANCGKNCCISNVNGQLQKKQPQSVHIDDCRGCTEVCGTITCQSCTNDNGDWGPPTSITGSPLNQVESSNGVLRNWQQYLDNQPSDYCPDCS